MKCNQTFFMGLVIIHVISCGSKGPLQTPTAKDVPVTQEDFQMPYFSPSPSPTPSPSPSVSPSPTPSSVLIPVIPPPIIVVQVPPPPPTITCNIYTYSSTTGSSALAPNASTLNYGDLACAQAFTNVIVGQNGYTAELTVDTAGPTQQKVQSVRHVEANGQVGSRTPDGNCFPLYKSSYVWANVLRNGIVVKSCGQGLINVTEPVAPTDDSDNDNSDNSDE